MLEPQAGSEFVLPDLLAPGLRIVFCGTAPSKTSAAKRAYYAYKYNKFWQTLHEIGITPREFQPTEFSMLLSLGVGLTDLCKLDKGNDDELKKTSFDAPRVKAEMLKLQPRVLAFTSKNAGKYFYGRTVQYGEQSERIGQTRVFVLPSTSPAARRVWSQLPVQWKAAVNATTSE